MDDEALSRFVDESMRHLGGSPGAFLSDDGVGQLSNQADEVGKQVLMAALRRGYYSTEPVAVGVDGKIDVEYGNKGQEISPVQQLTNSGYLSATVENRENPKQERYRMLRSFGALAGPLGDEIRALEDDEDVHSVSDISGGLDTNTDHFSPCAIDCWLKKRTTPRAGLPSLDASRWHLSARVFSERDYADIYAPLAKGHTRILCLEPGSFGDEIICSLTSLPCAVAGTGHVTYEALSYTWGDPTPKFAVKCNGRNLPVAHNLFQALQHLRHATDRRMLWVDAICINQNDTKEKNEQIPHMLDIYSCATKVVVWLGEESETSGLAIDSMKRLDKPLERKAVMYRVHESNCYEQLRAVCGAFHELLERPWFVRSWIRQELLAAKEVVVVCGRHSLSWYTLKRSAARLGHLRHKLSKESGVPISGPESTRQGLPISSLTRGWVNGQQLIGLIGNIRSIWYYHAGGLLELLMTSRNFEATDPRDKVYALLGLGRVPIQTYKQTDEAEHGTSTGAPRFPLDYSKPLTVVYQDTVKYFINRDRNLDILVLLLTTRNARSDVELPSWALDWRIPAVEIPITRHWDFITTKFAASGLHSKAELQDHNDKGILRCKGFPVDRIAAPLDFTTSVSGMLSLLYREDPETVPRTSDGADPAAVTDQATRLERTNFAQRFDPSEHNTRCFRTEHGRVCLAPAGARLGDDIAVLLGGKHLFVLRNAGRSGVYKTQGPCVLPVAMFGHMTKMLEDQGGEAGNLILI